MKHRMIAVAVLLAVPLLGSGPAGAKPKSRPTAELVDVHEIRSAAKPGAGAANCSNDGPATGTFGLTGWRVAAGTTSTLNTTTVPGSLDVAATVAALQASYNAWSGAPAVAVATSTTTATRPTANHRYEIMWGRTSGGSLAIAYTWRWSTGEVESDVIFNKGVSWRHLGLEGDGCYEGAGSVYDVANIATHEFGHVYGLDHPSGARYETMYAYGYSGETLKRSPAAGDQAGIAAIYP